MVYFQGKISLFCTYSVTGVCKCVVAPVRIIYKLMFNKPVMISFWAIIALLSVGQTFFGGKSCNSQTRIKKITENFLCQ